MPRAKKSKIPTEADLKYAAYQELSYDLIRMFPNPLGSYQEKYYIEDMMYSVLCSGRPMDENCSLTNLFDRITDMISTWKDMRSDLAK